MLKLIFRFFSTAVSLEGVKACLRDQKGGLVLPIGGMPIEDKDWNRYKSLMVDKTVNSINSEDLPDDFCQNACELVDEFRRKTVNENVEWMLYFDYATGEVVYCWQGQEDKSGGYFNSINFMGRKIASIHSHPNCYSFPSPDNFDILENDFEDYEIITSYGAMWIVEFKGSVDKKIRENFQFKIGDDVNDVINTIRLYYILDIDEITE